jgi:hypothetical protein
MITKTLQKSAHPWIEGLGSWACDGCCHVQGPKKKHVVGSICSIDKINDGLSLTSVKKGFWFKQLKDKTT